MPKYTLNIPDDLLESLREYHARHYAEYRRPFAAFVRDALAAWLAAAVEREATTPRQP